MIIEPERLGKTISDDWIAFGVSGETWYKWKRRYDAYGIDGLKAQSRSTHNFKNVKISQKLEKPPEVSYPYSCNLRKLDFISNFRLLSRVRYDKYR